MFKFGAKIRIFLTAEPALVSVHEQKTEIDYLCSIMMRWSSFVLLIVGAFSACTSEYTSKAMTEKKLISEKTDTAVFGSGCFWCSQAVFQSLVGVEKVRCGYAGGHTQNPDYESVCTNTTGHAEVVEIVFDPAQISFRELLEIFFMTHDPTTLNRQGMDVGSQYRSVIFYRNESQKDTALAIIKEMEAENIFEQPLVTEVSPLPVFYQAEAYHQDYFAKNPQQGYCQAVIRPKMEKFRKTFREKLK